ncbi:MAG: hypothetical protein ACKPB0_15810 [Opitutaceae bacterium]
MHTDHIQPERLSQVFVDLAEHLVWLDYFHAEVGLAQHRLPQAMHHAYSHTGLKAGAEPWCSVCDQLDPFSHPNRPSGKHRGTAQQDSQRRPTGYCHLSRDNV